MPRLLAVVAIVAASMGMAFQNASHAAVKSTSKGKFALYISGTAYTEKTATGTTYIRYWNTWAECDAFRATKIASDGTKLTSSTKTYRCQDIVTAVFGPHVACGPLPSPKPQGCPAGTVGSWTQIPTQSAAPACTVTWSPSSPPEGACVPEGPTTDQFTKCADEGGRCAFTGRRFVQYGCTPDTTGCPIEGFWPTARVFTDGMNCTNTAWGSDPIPGVLKQCRVDLTTVPPEAAPPKPPINLTNAVSWTIVNQDVNGNPAQVIATRLYYGTSAAVLSNTVDVPAPATSYQFTNLAPGTYYIAAAQVIAPDVVSVRSPTVTKVIEAPPQTGSWPQPPMSGMLAVNEAASVVVNAGRSALSINPNSPEPVTPGSFGEFRTSCLTSHMNFDDPLLYPGASNVGRSHHHTFFGNTASSATADLNNLRSIGNSTCSGGAANKSSYWIPSMIDTRTGRAIRPRDIGVYYKSGFSSHPRDIQAMPPGLKMLTGKGMALVGAPSGRDAPIFHCHYEGPTGGPELKGNTVPACPYTSPNSYTGTGSVVWGQIDFPMCWNGRDLDSADHKSHMFNKWDNGGECPASHPVELPSITFNIIWPVQQGDDPSAWRLSSDMPGHQDGWSFHADWINGWDPAIVDLWLNLCIRAGVDCHSDNLGDGRRLN